ncbi:hypothetical protein H4O18_17785 [Arenibacter sp. BSSL-BM3]|uniref:DUF4382 domain-containing protein n=1 Tax=Arenibacter arenosicollis TaxID=2762274 RepID=A0ABR7QRN5_9FLAO|nr:hypothetical protein [Arenibacter arenosicollis]MBC8769855.1 hypothetical protein [Arenibacter arenosicollis]
MNKNKPMTTNKLRIVTIFLFFIFSGCDNSDDYLNDYEVEINITGDVSEFDKFLAIASARNDGEGEFIGENLLFLDSSEIAPIIFFNSDLEAGTYKFVTARKAQSLQISHENKFISTGETSIDASMTITVIVKRDGREIDYFNISYDESTGDEEFLVNYNSDNDGYKCYCTTNCNQLLGHGGIGPAIPCD